jgi:hypothetical protein
MTYSYINRKSLTYQEVVTRLRDPKPDHKGGVMAFCPIHNDGKAHGRRSLHVSPGKNGAALVFCFAGCRAEDILRALRGDSQ